MISFTVITRTPIMEGKPDTGWRTAKPVEHPDKGFIGVQVDGGTYLHVEPDGVVEDHKTTLGAGERFTEGTGCTVVTVDAEGVPHVFAVA